MTKELHVGVVEDGARVGGAQVNIFTLAKNLSPRYRLTVLCPQAGELIRELEWRGISHVGVPMRRLISSSTRIKDRFIFNPFTTAYDFAICLLQGRILAKLLRRNRVDVVHTNSMWAHLMGGIAARMVGIPCLWHVQDIISDRLCFGLITGLFTLAAKRLASRVVVVSQAMREMFSGNEIPPVEVVHNGVDTEWFSVKATGNERQEVRTLWNIPENAILVGLVARLTPWKGQRTFLSAAKEALRMRNDLYFALIGKAARNERYYEAQLRTMARSMLPKGRMVFAGYRNDLLKVLSALDIGVLASEEPEPFGRVLVEYMARGLPVIGTAVGGATECVRNRETGILIPPNNTGVMANAIVELAGDELLRKKMGNSGRHWAEAAFSGKDFAVKFERIYEDLVRS